MQKKFTSYICTAKAVGNNKRGPARVNSDKRHGPRVVTARKVKSRQETTSLRQIATVTANPTISDKHL